MGQFDPSFLPDEIQGDERNEMIEDANKFLDDALRMNLPNLHTYLGRKVWKFLISAYINDTDGKVYTVEPVEIQKTISNGGAK